MMPQFAKYIIKKTLYNSALEKLKAIIAKAKSIFFNFNIKRVQANHKKALRLIKNKEKFRRHFGGEDKSLSFIPVEHQRALNAGRENKRNRKTVF